MEEFKLPFGYISFTQKKQWMDSRKQYWENYILNKYRFENDGILFGKRISTWLEQGELSGMILSEEEVEIIGKFSVLEQPEADERVNVGDGLVLRVKVDTSNNDFCVVGEYKTGLRGNDREWKKKFEGWKSQLRFYICALNYKRKEEGLEGGVPKGFIEYAETVNIDISEQYPEGKKFKGKVERFDYEFTEEEMEMELIEIRKVAMEISDAWRLEQSDELPWVNRGLFYDYVELKRKEDVLKRKMKEMSGGLVREMNEEGLRLFSVPGAVFSLTATGKLSISLK